MPKPVYRQPAIKPKAIDEKPTYPESNDFWIVLTPVFVALQPELSEANQYVRADEMRQKAYDAYEGDLPTEESSLELVYNDYVDSVKNIWKLAYGIRFDIDMYQEKY